jgi:hypothetical protein
VAPCDWATCHLKIGLYCPIISTVNVQSVSHIIIVHPSHLSIHLPHHLPYNHVSCHVTSILHSHPATSTSIQPSCHPYFHVSTFHWATSSTDYHVSSVQCHISNLYRFELSPKMLNLSDMCQLLVMPHHHDDVKTQ